MKRLMMLTAAGLAIAFSATVAQCQVVVSSKIDEESAVLGNIILAVLKHNKIETTYRLRLGTTPVLRKAMIAGEIDIYPEYTGNAAFFFSRADDPLWKGASTAYEEAKRLDYDANKIVWLTPSPANRAWAIALRKDVADKNELKTLSDFGRFVVQGGTVVVAASSEFIHSAAGLLAFQTAYGFTLKSDQLTTTSDGNTASTIAAAANRTENANAAMVHGTDGGISRSDLVVMEDDKHAQSVYQPAPIIREDVLKKHPYIEQLLEPVFAALDLKALQELNARVELGGESPKEVAVDFLIRNGFVK
ncbi:glycine betaine ABC transporter substrate-binding protein [uncultured Agrobacterium sp.]|uniref:glycine betaine ABC transporter substrate-binding protein OsmF n=1 Tax=uncultured Agrobacterium sp. TaxID=157277 RepID=UPI0025FC397D|nr:glycine betaine ABC transporter substrate-binding protein [uncultured Agrobacterium sp.]